ncbi:dorsal-ventral patterning protein Sog [Elysia marginata]|uniref:Dorsal-ventral patterning protein Sog n=1 Tax=Elysia marginata TaxID=1093978 RepID=A0AAV4JFW7_9GAST|nr:dorsal-ventral patterning protein Sog [Elysia marginata]
MHLTLITACIVSLPLVVTAKTTAQEKQTSGTIFNLPSGCIHEGRHYHVGESIEDGCKLCLCRPGNENMTCVVFMCDWPRCPETMELRVQPGDCCPRCVAV